VVVPELIRPALRTLISGVVARAQERYRQRVRLVGADADPQADAPVQPSSCPELWRLGDHWALISSVIQRELADYPGLAERLLLALVNESHRAPIPTPARTGTP
jgi:hypothetical protein